VSVEINVSVNGAEEFQAVMHKFDSAMQQQIRRQLADWAASTKILAEHLVPVRTGHLRGSIFARIHEWIAEIGAEASYASFVEFGTRHMYARPFLLPAIREHLPKLEQMICEAIDRAGAEAGLG
jgi:HK97 gp10 family phage protein